MIKVSIPSLLQIPHYPILKFVILTAGLSLMTAQAEPGAVSSAKDADQDMIAPAISLANKDWDALRAWFHQPQFNISDGLSSYAEDYHSSKAIKIKENLAVR